MTESHAVRMVSSVGCSESETELPCFNLTYLRWRWTADAADELASGTQQLALHRRAKQGSPAHRLTPGRRRRGWYVLCSRRLTSLRWRPGPDADASPVTVLLIIRVPTTRADPPLHR